MQHRIGNVTDHLPVQKNKKERCNGSTKCHHARYWVSTIHLNVQYYMWSLTYTPLQKTASIFGKSLGNIYMT